MAALYYPELVRAAFHYDGKLYYRGSPVHGVNRHIGGRLASTGRFLQRALPLLADAGLIRIEPQQVVVVDHERFIPTKRRKREGGFTVLPFKRGALHWCGPEARGLGAHLQRIAAGGNGTVPVEPGEIMSVLRWHGQRSIERNHVEKWLKELWKWEYLRPHAFSEKHAVINDFDSLREHANARS